MDEIFDTIIDPERYEDVVLRIMEFKSCAGIDCIECPFCEYNRLSGNCRGVFNKGRTFKNICNEFLNYLHNNIVYWRVR